MAADSPATTVDWDCVGLPRSRFCLLVLNQPIPPGLVPLFKQLWSAAQLRVAADGGANSIHAVRDALFAPSSTTTSIPTLDAIVGDLDSLSPEARAYFPAPTEIVQDQSVYSTDFAKAVHHIWDGRAADDPAAAALATDESSERHPQQQQPPPLDIVCVGGLGGRVDQGISTLHHLFLFQQSEGGGGPGGGSPGYARGRLWLLGAESLTFMLAGGGVRHAIRVRQPGGEGEGGGDDSSSSRPLKFAKHVGILPAREPSSISTRGLEWDVEDWPTALGGQVSTSNHLTGADVVEVRSTRDVLFTLALNLA